MGEIDLPSVERVVLVASGKGGVGKSTVAANLAVGLVKQGFRVGLLDADLHGPSVPTMFSAFDRPSIRSQKIQPLLRYGVRVLSIGMFADKSRAFIWQGPLLRGALRQLFRDTEWGDLDILLIDLPPGTGEVQISIFSLIDIFGAVLVTTPQQVALASVRRCVTMFYDLGVPILAVVENMSFYRCQNCGESHQIFPGSSTALAEEVGIAAISRLPLWSYIATSGDDGIPALMDERIADTDFAAGIEEVIGAVVHGLPARPNIVAL